MSWFSRFANVFRPSRVDRALDEEIAFHLERVRAVSGIESASAMSSLPFDRPFRVNQSEISNNTTGAPTVGLDYQRVMSRFFETTRIPIVRGRTFDAVDAASPASVAVVNETFARTYWGGLDPIGQRLRPGGTMPWFTVIGVARDIKQTGVDEDVRPEAYVFVDQLASPTLTSFSASRQRRCTSC